MSAIMRLAIQLFVKMLEEWVPKFPDAHVLATLPPLVGDCSCTFLTYYNDSLCAFQGTEEDRLILLLAIPNRRTVVYSFYDGRYNNSTEVMRKKTYLQVVCAGAGLPSVKTNATDMESNLRYFVNEAKSHLGSYPLASDLLKHLRGMKETDPWPIIDHHHGFDVSKRVVVSKPIGNVPPIVVSSVKLTEKKFFYQLVGKDDKYYTLTTKTKRPELLALCMFFYVYTYDANGKALVDRDLYAQLCAIRSFLLGWKQRGVHQNHDVLLNKAVVQQAHVWFRQAAFYGMHNAGPNVKVHFRTNVNDHSVWCVQRCGDTLEFTFIPKHYPVVLSAVTDRRSVMHSLNHLGIPYDDQWDVPRLRKVLVDCAYLMVPDHHPVF